MTVKEVRDYALAHYNNGGDAIYECWDDNDIQELIDTYKNNDNNIISALNHSMVINEERRKEITKLVEYDPCEHCPQDTETLNHPCDNGMICEHM